MVTKVVMPRLSLTMKTGTVVQWFKKEGDTVQKGEPLVEVLSEKVTYDVEAPQTGVLAKILALEGMDVPVAQAIGVVAAPGEQISEADVEKTSITAQLVPTEETVLKESVETVEQRIAASPAAKKLAREQGVDLVKVLGSGPEGRIVEEDVKRFLEGLSIGPRIREVVPLTGIRKTTAERLSHSFRTAPHSTVITEVDMTKAVKLREQSKVSYTDILVKAVAQALKEHPIINSALDGDQVKIFEDINVGVAVATEKGLVVPVVHNADRKSLSEVASVLKESVERAKEGKLIKEDLTGGTFTITNLGMYGVDIFIPIINPPETAILGVGKITDRPLIINKTTTVKPVTNLSLAYDHRVVDGAPAAEFLMKVKQFLENPTPH